MGLSQGKLEDRYYLQKVKLGQGAFGTVWRAVDRQSNAAVAVKQLDKASMPRRGVKREDIEREINVMQAMNHENVLRLLDTFEDHSSIFLALEYCDGGDFGDKVNERGLSLEEPQAAAWMRQILSAIAALHAKNVCHRDIKPDNFMVHGEVLKLSDFGLALFLTRGRLLTDKCGTPAFMAPEQHKLPKYSRGYTHAVDMWAAGVTMYMLMFGGRHPFLDDKMRMDEKRLMQGAVDFVVPQSFFSFGMPGQPRFSDAARRLCKRLVEPDLARRPTAEDACQDPWLACGGPPPANQGPDSARGPAAASKVPRTQSQSWWPFKVQDENMHPNGPAEEQKKVPESEAILRKRIEMLEEQVRLQQEQNEAQWDALVNNQQQMQEQRKLAEQQLAEEQRLMAEAGGVNPPQKPSFNKPVASPPVACAPSPAEASPDRQRRPPTTPRAVITVLPVGTRCRYNSRSHSGWLPAVVEGFNSEDGTYNLDIRRHAEHENISPASDVTTSEAWPPGTLVHYESSSLKHWLPCRILSFNEGTGTYNLDVRDSAQVDRLRIRLG